MGKSMRVSSGNGGIAGSGVFGMFGSTVVCKSEDNSYYCNFMKFFNVLVIVLIILFILYFVYTYFLSIKSKRR
jgi:hypothetical protein